MMLIDKCNRRFRIRYTLLSMLAKQYDNPLSFATFATTDIGCYRLQMLKKMVTATGEKVQYKHEVEPRLLEFYGVHFTKVKMISRKHDAIEEAVPRDLFNNPYYETFDEFMDFWIINQAVVEHEDECL